MDAVYVVRRGANEELRHSLRSVARHVAVETVWVIGQPPTWVQNVNVIRPRQQGSDKYYNTTLSLKIACQDDRISDPFMLWNDDFFVLQPLRHLDWHWGTLCDYLCEHPKPNAYRNGCTVVRDFLVEEGFLDPLSFELHIPLIVYKDVMLSATQDAMALPRLAPWKRSIYGNRAVAQGLLRPTSREDVKIYVLGEKPNGSQDWVSTNDQTFRRGAVGRYLRRTFPEQSVYER